VVGDSAVAEQTVPIAGFNILNAPISMRLSKLLPRTRGANFGVLELRLIES
jgi:hypothetical protein